MEITAKTQMVGVIGWPVSHSVSPAMHNAAFAALDLDWCYLPLPVPVEPHTRIGEAVQRTRARGGTARAAVSFGCHSDVHIVRLAYISCGWNHPLAPLSTSHGGWWVAKGVPTGTKTRPGLLKPGASGVT